jgi:hypothetical protein
VESLYEAIGFVGAGEEFPLVVPAAEFTVEYAGNCDEMAGDTIVPA